MVIHLINIPLRFKNKIKITAFIYRHTNGIHTLRTGLFILFTGKPVGLTMDPQGRLAVTSHSPTGINSKLITIF